MNKLTLSVIVLWLHLNKINKKMKNNNNINQNNNNYHKKELSISIKIIINVRYMIIKHGKKEVDSLRLSDAWVSVAWDPKDHTQSLDKLVDNKNIYVYKL